MLWIAWKTSKAKFTLESIPHNNIHVCETLHASRIRMRRRQRGVRSPLVPRYPQSSRLACHHRDAFRGTRYSHSYIRRNTLRFHFSPFPLPFHVLSKPCFALPCLHGDVADSRADLVLPAVELETEEEETRSERGTSTESRKVGSRRSLPRFQDGIRNRRAEHQKLKGKGRYAEITWCSRQEARGLSDCIGPDNTQPSFSVWNEQRRGEKP